MRRFSTGWPSGSRSWARRSPICGRMTARWATGLSPMPQAAHHVAVERLKTLRRLGNELTDEQTQSFRMSVDRLAAQIGRLQQRRAA